MVAPNGIFGDSAPPPRPLGAPGSAPLAPVTASPFAEPAVPVAAGPRPRLTPSDRSLMNALAAQQLRYGKAEEALAILQMVNRMWPDDEQTLRLLSQCFVALEDWAAAEATIDAHERLSGEASLTEGDWLRRSVIALRRYGLQPAQSMFRRFMDKIAGRARS